MGAINNFFDAILNPVEKVPFILPNKGKYYRVSRLFERADSLVGSDNWMGFRKGDLCWICPRRLIADGSVLIRDNVPKSNNSFVIINSTCNEDEREWLGDYYIYYSSGLGLVRDKKNGGGAYSDMYYLRRGYQPLDISIQEKNIDVISRDRWFITIQNQSLLIHSDSISGKFRGMILHEVTT